ncbi:MAG: hypothetical protein JO056_09975 [Alphaproteobacteria bacterium]|nr:hypothetical protein [Alphaproteobacteria bacterium]
MTELSTIAFMAGSARRRFVFRHLQLLFPLSQPLYEAAAILALCPLLLSAAIWNGYPLIFYDTGAYMLQSFGDKFVPERSPVFSLFIFFAGGGKSLWLVAIAETAVAAFVLVETARAVAPRVALPAVFVIGAALTILTALPWYAGQIEPDIFTPVLILVLYLLAFHVERLGWWRSALLIAIAALCTAVHPSHLGLAAGLVIVLVVFWLFAVWRGSWPAPNLPLPISAVCLGLCLIWSANYHFTRHIFVSRAGPVFMFARMLQDGVVQKVLDETCPSADLMLCRYRKVLPHRADKWLWGPGTPFVKLHRFLGTEKESTRIVHEALTRYPLWNLELAARDAAQQFTLFYTGDQIEPQQWILFRDFLKFIPDQLPAYGAARQQKGKLHFGVINVLHVPIGFAVLAMLLGGAGWAFYNGDRRSAPLLGFILVALIGNAIVCGVFSNPHARYQSRLIWVPAYVLALLWLEKRALPGNGGITEEPSRGLAEA